MALALRADHDFLNRVEEFLLRCLLLVFACGENGGFVHDVHEVGAAHANRALCNAVQVDVRVDGFADGVDVENCFAFH